MATKRPEYTWQNGFRQVALKPSRVLNGDDANEVQEDSDAYVSPPSVELVTSPRHNEHGVNVIVSWPTLYDGTNNPHGLPSWWQPQEKVDVLICGAGPSGLAVAASLLRQGVSFRIIDKADRPLDAGRADGVQPRFLETIATFGLAKEVHEEGPIIDRTAMYKNGNKLAFTHSHQSDSRYRGLHVITQGQIERIYIRDLLRHKVIVERSSILSKFSVDNDADSGNTPDSYPVHATIHNEKTGEDQVVRAKFLVGSDGGASSIRKGLKIPFDGVSTDIYWGIMDCIFESDYPHAWTFGMVMSTNHGCCCIIPREDGYIRLYTQLDISHTGPISASRLARDPTFAETGGNVDVHSITPDEVLEQANKIFAPYKLKFASSLSWFSIWKISERVARSFSSPDMRIHLAGDAAHIHSVLGAFGLNAGILDAANLGWKLGLAAKGQAKIKSLLSTYGAERRKHAARIIHVSGEYLRFVSGSALAVPDLANPDALDKVNGHNSNGDVHAKKANGVGKYDPEAERRADMEFLAKFFQTNGQFLLGVDCEYDESVIAPPTLFKDGSKKGKSQVPVRVGNGVRAPNPRVCFSTNETGYLYDKLTGTDRFHLVLFASSLAGTEVRRQVGKFTESLKDPRGFYRRFGGARFFHIVLVVKLLPFEFEALAASEPGLLGHLREIGATVVFDDRAPDEDAHTTWGVDHNTGGVAFVRPDLWVGMTCFPEEENKMSEYFGGFIQEV